MIIPALLAMIAGCLVVVSRNINAQLSDQIGLLQGTVYNYLVGLSVSVVFLLLTLGNNLQVNISYIPLWAYAGGAIGVTVVLISNYVAVRIPAFTLTLIVFLGQLLTGILLDALKTGSASMGEFLGAVLVIIGFLYNAKIEQG